MSKLFINVFDHYQKLPVSGNSWRHSWFQGRENWHSSYNYIQIKPYSKYSYIYVYGRELGTKISDTNKLTYRECTGYFKWWVYYRFYKGCLQQIAIKIFSLVYSVWYICTSENYKVTQLLKGLSIYRRIRKQIELAGPTGRPIKWTPIQVWVRSAWPWHSSLT